MRGPPGRTDVEVTAIATANRHKGPPVSHWRRLEAVGGQSGSAKPPWFGRTSLGADPSDLPRVGSRCSPDGGYEGQCGQFASELPPLEAYLRSTSLTLQHTPKQGIKLTLLVVLF